MSSNARKKILATAILIGLAVAAATPQARTALQNLKGIAGYTFGTITGL